MYRVICFCKRHREMNIYHPMPYALALEVQAMYPGYRAIVYEG